MIPTTLTTPVLARIRELLTVPTLFFIAMGFVPIGSLCAALFGILPLSLGLQFVVAPLGLLTIGVGIRYPQLGRVALRGLLVGVVATMVYDLVRLSFVMAGAWGDFIPVIGKLALNDEAASPIWGYLWRFIGNGGMMGMAFAFVPWRGTRAGIIYGIGVCCCLFGTLLIAPGAQDTLFQLKPLTALMALIGHIIYGAVLGWLLQHLETRTPRTTSHATVLETVREA